MGNAIGKHIRRTREGVFKNYLDRFFNKREISTLHDKYKLSTDTGDMECLVFFLKLSEFLKVYPRYRFPLFSKFVQADLDEHLCKKYFFGVAL